MTVEAIARQAAARPGAVAVIDNGRRVTFAEVARDIGRFSRALRALGLRQGQSVAVECRDPYLHLLLCLAGERLGLVTASFLASEVAGSAPLPLLARVDAVLTEVPAQARGAKKVFAITKAWVESVAKLAVDTEPPAPRSPNDPLRILRTSGTTGLPKYVLLRRAAHDGRVNAWLHLDGIAAGHRILIAQPLMIIAMYLQCAAALRTGATIVFEGRIKIVEAIALHGVTHMTLLTLHLRRIVDSLDPDFVKPPGLTVTSQGGRFPGVLRRRLLERLATQVREHHSGNEAGSISSTETNSEEAAGVLLPGVEVEFVDQHGAVVPPGETGNMRVRAAYMVEGYLDDPEMTARRFRDGWFYPGDLGIKHPDGKIEVVGRDDELINIGGVKIQPGELEEALLARAPVSDVGVCAIANADGVDEVWFAIVSTAPNDVEIRQKLSAVLRGFPFGVVHLQRLAAIPRTATGKIRRAELRAALIEAARSRVGGRASSPLVSGGGPGDAGNSGGGGKAGGR